jgi:hypothetical protein
MEDTAGAGAPEAGGAARRGWPAASAVLDRENIRWHGVATPRNASGQTVDPRQPDSQRFTSFPVFRENSSTRLLPEFLTVEQVAAVLSTCTASLYKLCRYGGLPHTRVRPQCTSASNIAHARQRCAASMDCRRNCGSNRLLRGLRCELQREPY